MNACLLEISVSFQENFISPTVFGDILYENFIFDIPKIMDLCALYGATNGPLLSKMIGNIFTQQPKYQNDLVEVVPTILQVKRTLLTWQKIKLNFFNSAPKSRNELGRCHTLSFEDTNEHETLWFV